MLCKNKENLNEKEKTNNKRTLLFVLLVIITILIIIFFGFHKTNSNNEKQGGNKENNSPTINTKPNNNIKIFFEDAIEVEKYETLDLYNTIRLEGDGKEHDEARIELISEITNLRWVRSIETCNRYISSDDEKELDNLYERFKESGIINIYGDINKEINELNYKNIERVYLGNALYEKYEKCKIEEFNEENDGLEIDEEYSPSLDKYVDYSTLYNYFIANNSSIESERDFIKEMVNAYFNSNPSLKGIKGDDYTAYNYIYPITKDGQLVNFRWYVDIVSNKEGVDYENIKNEQDEKIKKYYRTYQNMLGLPISHDEYYNKIYRELIEWSRIDEKETAEVYNKAYILNMQLSFDSVFKALTDKPLIIKNIINGEEFDYYAYAKENGLNNTKELTDSILP